MSQTDRRAALEELTAARKALEESTPETFEELNDAVIAAEKKVPFSRMRGWNY